MDDRIRKRLFALYLGAVINAYAGLYLLIEGLPMLARNTAMWVGIVFLVIAFVEFLMAPLLRRQWELGATQGASRSRPPPRA